MSDAILIVDDSEQDVELLREAFKETGRPVKILSSESVERAQDYLVGRGEFADRKAHPLPRLILLDIQMPLKDGFELLFWLRGRGDDLKRLPVIMMTTSHASNDIRRAYDSGANSFLVKPTGFDELVKVVARIGDYWLDSNRPAALL
jgi:CheY-like chemotaxis protein